MMTPVADLAATPSSIDWSELGATTPVKDQGQCGSCLVYSTTEGIESSIYMAQGTLPELAVQQIISCDKSDGGCQGEDANNAFTNAAVENCAASKKLSTLYNSVVYGILPGSITVREPHALPMVGTSQKLRSAERWIDVDQTR